MVVHYDQWSERRQKKCMFFVVLIDKNKQCKRMVVHYNKWSERRQKNVCSLLY